MVLDELRTCTGPPDRLPVYHLSALGPANADIVAGVWPRIAAGVRRQVVEYMVELAEADFEMDFSAVFRIALDDEDPEVRRAAVEGLWEDEDVRLVPHLAARLLEDEAAAVRAAAASSLGRFVLLGELNKIRPGPYAAAYDALLRCCGCEEDSEVWRRAIESLAYVNNAEVTALIERAYAASDERIRVSAIFAMGRSAHERWGDHIRQELFSPNPELRFEGARACGELSLGDAVLELEELVDDVDREVREAALWSLGQIGGDRAREVIERQCLSEDESTRRAADSALAELEFLSGELSQLLHRLAQDTGN